MGSSGWAAYGVGYGLEVDNPKVQFREWETSRRQEDNIDTSWPKRQQRKQ